MTYHCILEHIFLLALVEVFWSCPVQYMMLLSEIQSLRGKAWLITYCFSTELCFFNTCTQFHQYWTQIRLSHNFISLGIESTLPALQYLRYLARWSLLQICNVKSEPYLLFNRAHRYTYITIKIREIPRTVLRSENNNIWCIHSFKTKRYIQSNSYGVFLLKKRKDYGIRDESGDGRMENYITLKSSQHWLKDKKAIEKIFLLESSKVIMFFSIYSLFVCFIPGSFNLSGEPAS